MVKVRVTVPLGKSVLPKSVWSAPLGVVSPSMIVVPLPRILISGAGHSRPLQGEVVGILVRVVVAHAQGRGPRAHCTRIEANLEARVPPAPLHSPAAR